MRTGIHPDYVECKVTCSCGETFVTRSTKPELHVELCSKCHPFYTGTQKLVDSGGRVQRFADKFGNAAANVAKKEADAREARQKAAEEAALSAREAKAFKDSTKAERAAKVEVASAIETGEAVADVVEEPAPEETAAEAAEEVVVETAEEIAEESAE
ncbi:MAG: 50S ribosomal protein L31 [Actinobacteria bacterium]|nr:50S ribosomal protein L31 [Actinomycetota bacterium]